MNGNSKYILLLAFFATFFGTYSSTNAWAWKKSNNFSHTYDVNCGNQTCVATVTLKEITDPFAPTGDIFWQFKVNNPSGPYSQLVKSGNTYSFVFDRNTATTYYLLNVRSVSKAGVTESKNDFALNDFYSPKVNLRNFIK